MEGGKNMSRAIILDRHKIIDKIVAVDNMPEEVIVIMWNDTIYVNSNIKNKEMES
ncbi:MAG: hypothetical protein H0Z28_12770 [Archaeoglobus sp.]|nr:hypothetical protein [Archaeoglobus sp.]